MRGGATTTRNHDQGSDDDNVRPVASNQGRDQGTRRPLERIAKKLRYASFGERSRRGNIAKPGILLFVEVFLKSFLVVEVRLGQTGDFRVAHL